MISIKERGIDRLFGYFCNITATIILLSVIFPLLNILSCSFSDMDYVARGEIWLLPKGINFEGYKIVFNDEHLMIGYMNTIIYTLCGTILNLILTLTAGYALSKKSLPGRGFIMVYCLITMYFSGGMIPMYLLIRSLKLLDTRLVMIITGAISIYNLIVSRTFFQGIPKDLEDSAIIDGCSTFRLFIKIVIPLSKALIGVLALYYGVSHWNSYHTALIYISSNNKKPLQLFLRKILVLLEMPDDVVNPFESSERVREAEKLKQLIQYSSIVVSSLPVIIIYPFLQKYFDKGVLLGSLKG
jgi:putative aldouronate transport system permease protein